MNVLANRGRLRARLVRSSIALTSAALLCLAAGIPDAAASESREFSSEETELLRAGKLVVRPEQRDLGSERLLGGLAWQLVDAPVASVWRAVDDVHAYPHFLPAVVEAREVDAIGDVRRIFIRHRLGFVTASYFVKAKYDAAHALVRFRLDKQRPSSLRDAWGELHVTAYGTKKSVVSLAIMADVGEGLVAGLVRSNVHQWMLRVPELLKRYVEAQHS